jgi:hypothetical protein
LNRENRETPFGRAKGNSYGGRLFAGETPTGFQGPSAQAALRIAFRAFRDFRGSPFVG